MPGNIEQVIQVQKLVGCHPRTQIIWTSFLGSEEPKNEVIAFGRGREEGICTTGWAILCKLILSRDVSSRDQLIDQERPLCSFQKISPLFRRIHLW